MVYSVAATQRILSQDPWVAVLHIYGFESSY